MTLFVFLKIGQWGPPFGEILKKNKFVKCSIWYMIYVGNLILRSMMVEDLIKSYYFKSYSWFSVIFWILYHGPERIWKNVFFFIHSGFASVQNPSWWPPPRKFYTGYRTRKINFSPKFCTRYKIRGLPVFEFEWYPAKQKYWQVT